MTILAVLVAARTMFLFNDNNRKLQILKLRFARNSTCSPTLGPEVFFLFSIDFNRRKKKENLWDQGIVPQAGQICC